MSLRITDHALVQLGKRYALTWGASEFRTALGTAKAIFRMSGGDVVPFYVRTLDIYGYAVVTNGRVVTTLTERQAFVDCPRAVFTFLVRKGQMEKAFSLRSYYKSLRIAPQDEQSVRYAKACDTIWCAFKFLEGDPQRK